MKLLGLAPNPSNLSPVRMFSVIQEPILQLPQSRASFFADITETPLLTACAYGASSIRVCHLSDHALLLVNFWNRRDAVDPGQCGPCPCLQLWHEHIALTDRPCAYEI